MKLRLKEAIAASGLTQRAVAKRLGITTSSLSGYVTGAHEPKLELLVALARLCGCTVDFLLGLEPAAVPETPLPLSLYKDLGEVEKGAVTALIDYYAGAAFHDKGVEKNTKTIPLYLTAAAAGYAAPSLGEDYEDYEAPSDSGADFAVKISGDSMEPYISDGSVVLVRRTTQLQSGDVGIFCVDNDMYCKQYCEDHAGNIYLFSLNRRRADADITVFASGGRNVFCFGKVLLGRKPPLPVI